MQHYNKNINEDNFLLKFMQLPFGNNLLGYSKQISHRLNISTFVYTHFIEIAYPSNCLWKFKFAMNMVEQNPVRN